jgi:hypothetical protein
MQAVKRAAFHFRGLEKSLLISMFPLFSGAQNLDPYRHALPEMD